MVEDKSVQQMQAAGARLLQGSPGLASMLAKGQPSPAGAHDDRDSTISDLKRMLESEREKNRSLEDKYKFRVQSFVKRETQTKNKIEELEKRFTDGDDGDDHVQRMALIRTWHNYIVEGLEHMQDSTVSILQNQEKDLVRAFKLRLEDVTRGIEQQRSRRGEDSAQSDQHRRVVAELHETRELANVHDKQNRKLAAENAKLQEKLRTQQDDRKELLTQLVNAKKEAARLKAQSREGIGGGIATSIDNSQGSELETRDTGAVKPVRRSFSQKQIEQARLQQTRNRQYEVEVGYRETIQKLKRVVEEEKRASQVLQQQLNELLRQRTELEVFLRQCLDDVKSEILRRKVATSESQSPQNMALPTDAATPPILENELQVSSLSVNDLSPLERERVLELLLSQQRVVQLLYSKTFPQLESQDEEPQSSSSKPEAKHDDFSWLSNIIPPETMEKEGYGERMTPPL